MTHKKDPEYTLSTGERLKECFQQVLVGLLAEDEPEALQACWAALAAVAGAIPKEAQPGASFLLCKIQSRVSEPRSA